MTQFIDNQPYNIESPQKLLIQYSHDIEFDYSSGQYPDGTESSWDWENEYIPVEHLINGKIVGRTVFMRLRVGDSSNWGLPTRISDAITNIETVTTEIEDTENEFIFQIRLTFTDGSTVISEPTILKNGIDGTEITSAIINEAGHLIITYNDGTSMDAGQAKGEDAPGLPQFGHDGYVLVIRSNIMGWEDPSNIIDTHLSATSPIEYDNGLITHLDTNGNKHIPIGGNPGDMMITDGIGNYTWIDPTEIDPIFINSPAYGITDGDIINWNTAFSWGNHSGLYSLLSHTHVATDITNYTFENLTDTASYAGNALKLVQVNAGATGIDYIDNLQHTQNTDYRILKEPNNLELSTTALANDEQHLDHSASTWADVRNASSGNLNSLSYYLSMFYGTSWIIGRAIFRFDFTGQPSRLITSVNLRLPVRSGRDIIDTGFVYRLDNDEALTDSDFGNFSTLLSDEGVITGTGDSKSELISFNAAGIAAVQAAANSQSIITFMVRHRKDHLNIEPIGEEAYSEFSYSNSTLQVNESEGTSSVICTSSGVEINNTKYIDFGTNNINPSYREGSLFYDYSKKALSYYNEESEVTINLGQEQVIRVYNNSGATIPNGRVVAPLSTYNGVPTIQLACACAKDRSRLVGVATHSIENNSYGYVTKAGSVSGIDTSTFGANTLLYLSSTNDGTLTTDRPIDGGYSVIIGAVGDVGVNGSIVVDILVSSNTVEVTDTNGFPEDQRTLTTIGLVDGTRTFTIGASSYPFHFYQTGEKFEKQNSESVVIEDVTGSHIVYYDDGVLTSIANPTGEEVGNIVKTKCLISYIYWNAATSSHPLLNDERHGISMSPMSHYYLHLTRGAQYVSGLAPSDIIIGNGSLDSHAQFGMTAGSTLDEDLEISLAALLTSVGARYIYRTGVNGDWVTSTSSGFSFPVGVTPLPQFNEFTGATHQLTEITSGNYMNLHIFASSDELGKPIAVVGNQEYANAALASIGAEGEVGTILVNLPLPEFVPVASFIIEGKTSFTNSVQSRFVQTGIGDDYHDWRKSEISAGQTATDHNNLASLQLAGTGVTWGHIDDQAQTIYGEKTFNNLLKVVGTTTGGAGNLTAWYDSNALKVATLTDEGMLGLGGDFNPLYRLHTEGGDVMFRYGTGENRFLFSGNTSATADAKLYMYDNTGVNSVLFSTNGDSYFSGGYVGFGTTTPSEQIHIDGGVGNGVIYLESAAAGQSQILFGASDGQGKSSGFIKYSDNADAIFLGTNSTTKLYIDSVGNITQYASGVNPLIIKNLTNSNRIAFSLVNDDADLFLYDRNNVLQVGLRSEGDNFFNQGNVFVGKTSGNSKFGVLGLPTSNAGLTTGDFFTQTATELGGSGTTKVVCVF